MGLRSGLPNLGSPRRCVAALAAPIQLAPAAQQSKIKSAHQPPRSYRGQPVEAPHLVRLTEALLELFNLVRTAPQSNADAVRQLAGLRPADEITALNIAREGKALQDAM